jgi:hypothetical protein
MMILLAAILCTTAPQENLIQNGDFEQTSNGGVPPGWKVWGGTSKPGNFARETENPHGGKACFRMHHPRNTSAFAVSSPKHPIKTQPGTAYVVSFWARTDRPGPSVLYFEGFSQIKPYKEVTSPGRFPIAAEKTWKRFTARIDEGLDFKADVCRFILLAYRVTMDKSEQKTLWIDDVVVTAEKSTRAAGLIDPAKLEVPPLAHRLQRGERLAFSIDPSSKLGPTTRLASGISFHRLSGWKRHPYDEKGKYVLPKASEEAVRDLRLPMTRFYGVGDEPFDIEGALDRASDVLKRVGIPQETTVLELETQGATTRLDPAAWAAAAGYAERRGYAFRHWEVSNEPYTRKATAFSSPDDYIGHVKKVSAAIRRVQPEAQIGVGIWSSSPSWGNYVLKQAAGHYDFVVAHHYAVSDAYKRSFEAIVLSENYRKLEHILRLNALMKAYNPNRAVYQYDTEWGMHSNGPDGGSERCRRNANVVGMLHRAVRLIYYAREGLLRGASSWEMFCRLDRQGFGILYLDDPEARSYLYWLYYHFNRHVGDWALQTEGTAPWFELGEGDDLHLKAGAHSGPLTPVLATVTEDGKRIGLVVANGSWKRPVECNVTLKGFPAATASGIVLSGDDLDGAPIQKEKQKIVRSIKPDLSPRSVSFTVPAHAVVFVHIGRR